MSETILYRVAAEISLSLQGGDTLAHAQVSVSAWHSHLLFGRTPLQIYAREPGKELRFLVTISFFWTN